MIYGIDASNICTLLGGCRSAFTWWGCLDSACQEQLLTPTARGGVCFPFSQELY